jgi:hypothetical protein
VSGSSTTTLSLAPTTVMYGQQTVMTAIVTPEGPTGTVSFYEGNTLLGTVSLNGSETGVLPISSLPAGTHDITARYDGDPNAPASTSNTVQLTVTPLTAPGGGPAITVTVNDATRTSTEANPPFTYSAAGQLVNGDTYATAITGVPTYTTAAGTEPGTFAVTVAGLTSANYSITFVSGTLTVVSTGTTTTLVANPNSSQYGDPVTFTATTANGATGTVSFYDGSILLGEGTVSGGVATLAVTTLNATTHNITAVYNGDLTYASSASGPVSFAVGKKTGPDGGPALTVTVQDASREYGTANPQFNYVVTGTLLNGDTYPTAVTGVPIYAVADTSSSPAGTTYPINLSGLASENYDFVVVPGTLSIASTSTTATLALSTASTQYGDPVTLTTTIVPSGATGTVVFSEGTVVLGTGTVAGGVATLTISTLQAGSHSITSSYSGDGNFGGSTTGSVTVNVSQKVGPGGGAALTITVNDANRPFGQGNPAFSYTVTGALVNGDTYTTAVTGVPVYSTTATIASSAGAHPISVLGLSSRNYSSAFVNGTLTVVKATPGVAGTAAVTVASSLNPSISGGAVTFTATVPYPATGSVIFYDGAKVLGTSVVVNGTSTLTTSALPFGIHSITAQYGGDSNYNSATSAAISQLVNTPSGSGITLSVSPNPATSGSPITLTATVQPGATGTVTFNSGSTVLGTATITGTTATLIVSSLSPGSYSIGAHYNGDANHAPANATPVSLVVTASADFAIIVTTPSQLVPPGSTATYSVAVSSVTAPFANAVALSASGLPAGATYTFTPASVTPGSGGATSTLSITVPKQTTALDRRSKAPLALAVLLLPLVLLKRARNRPPRLLLWMLLTLASLGAVTGCGTGGYFNVPQQSYTITVTGTSGSLVHSATTTLTVE